MIEGIVVFVVGLLIGAFFSESVKAAYYWAKGKMTKSGES